MIENKATIKNPLNSNLDIHLIIKSLFPLFIIIVLSVVFSMGLRSTELATFFKQAQPLICTVMTVISVLQAWMLYKVFKAYRK